MIKTMILSSSLTFLAVTILFSQPPTDHAVCTASGTQDYPAITADGFGNVIVVWHDRRDGDASGGTDLYAQKINLYGQSLWQTNGVAVCTEPSNQGGQFVAEGQFVSGIGAVQIAPDGSGGAIVAWRDDRNGQFNGDIYAQRIYSSGAIAWAPEGVPVCTAANDQTYLRMISDDADGAIITWEDFRPGNAADIYAQRIDGSGNVLWQADGMAVCSANDAQRGPQIVSDTQSGAIVAWIDLRSPALPPQYDVYAQRVSAAGVEQWITNGIPVCRAQDDQYLNFNTSVIADGFGGAIVAWHDERAGGFGFQDIYAQRVNGQGAVLWQVNGAPVCTAADQQTNPVIAGDGAGGAFIVWPDLRDDPFELHGYLQRLDATGTAQFQQNGVQIAATPTQLPVVISTTPGNAIALWQDFRDNDSNTYIQGYDSTGAISFQPGGQLFVGGEGNEAQHVAVHVADGNFVAAWQDLRNGNDWDIYAAVGGKEPVGQQAVAIQDRFVDNGPEPKFLPLLRNDVLPAEGEVQITITSPPQFGSILSVESTGVWYQVDQEVTDQFTYALTISSQAGNAGPLPPNNSVLIREGNAIIEAFLCACGLLSNCGFGAATIGMLAEPTSQGSAVSVADSIDIALLLRGRDEVLGSTNVGSEMVDAFMFNSPEILQVLLLDRPDLLDHTLTTLEMLQGPTRSLVDGDGSEVITQALMDTVESLFANLSAVVSDELNQILQDNLSRLGPLDSYVGLPVKDAAEAAFGFATSVDDDRNAIPTRFALHPNYPNPFNPGTTIRYSVAREGQVRLTVYDLLGREVATLVDKRQDPGEYSVSFDAQALASGVYFARLQAGKQVLLRKMLLVR